MFHRAACLAAIVLVLAGCRAKDPLDWTVEGRNAVQLQNWIDETIAEMPPELAREFADAVVAIRDNTRGWSTVSPDTSLNPLCLRLKDRTVRDVMLEGLQLMVDNRQSRIKNNLSQIHRLVEATDGTEDERTRARYGRQVASLHSSVEREKELVAQLEKRIAELNGSATPSPPARSRM